MVNQYLCGGSMCFDEEERLFFSYDWPYLIKIITKEGNELFQFSRENNFNWTPFIFKSDNNGLTFSESTRSKKIFFLNNKYLINSILSVDWEGNPRIRLPRLSVVSKNPEKYFKVKRQYAVLDFYTKEREFISSAEIDDKIYFLCSDRKGRILGIKRDEEDIQTIVRYRIEIIRNK